MPYQTFQKNLETFSKLIDSFQKKSTDDALSTMTTRYIEQNLTILNDIFAVSITHLEQLKKASTVNEIICAQARLTNEISQKSALSTQRFLNASLGHIADYNEWLKAHCDLATD